MPLQDKRFPNESEKYRNARDKLLEAEIELRRQIERGQAGRTLPKGREVPEDYAFEEGGADIADDKNVRAVKMSQLFGDDEPSLIA